MSNVQITLSANTAQYVERLKKARTETDRNVIKMEQRIDKFASDINQNFTSIGSSIDTMLGGLRSIAGGGYIAAVAGIGIAGLSAASGIKSLATQVSQSERVLKVAMEQTRLGTNELRAMAAVANTVGLDLEKFGEMSQDIFDHMGDYATTGGGAFVDFFDVVKDKSNITIQELQKLSGPEVMMKVVEEMEKVGASGDQITWVLESIASDASKLAPLLKNGAKGFKDLQQRMEEVSRTPVLLGEAATEVQILDTAFESMWDSFGVMMTTKFDWLFSLMNEMAAKANGLFNDITLNSQASDVRVKIQSGAIDVDTSQDIAVLEQNRDAAKRAREDYLKNPHDFMSYDDKKRRENELAEAQRKANSTIIGLQIEGQKQLQALKEKYRKEDEAAAQRHIKNYDEQIRLYERAIANKKAAQRDSNSAGKEQIEKNFKIEGKTVDEIDAELKKITTAKDNANKRLIELGYERTEIEFQLEEETSDKIKKQISERLKANEKAVEAQNEIINGAIKAEQDAAKEKKKIVDEEVKAKEDAAKKIKAANEKAAREAKAAEEARLRGIISNLQHEVNSALTLSDKVNAQYALDQERYKQMLDARQITQEQHDNYMLQAKLAHAEGMKKIDLDKIQDENAREMAVAEWKKEWIQSQYDNELITKQQYDALRLESEKQYTNAKHLLTMAQLDDINATLSGLSGMAKQGSKEYAALFAVEKAATIAKMGIRMWDAWSAVDKDPTKVTDLQKLGAKALVLAQYGGGMAQVASTVMGQFHNGGEVDQTGSYILKQGERVVAPDTNKDLKNFLADSKKSGEIKIDAPLIIEGDTDVDPQKFQAMLIQHRDTLAKAIRVAQRENPSLR